MGAHDFTHGSCAGGELPEHDPARAIAFRQHAEQCTILDYRQKADMLFCHQSESRQHGRARRYGHEALRFFRGQFFRRRERQQLLHRCQRYGHVFSLDRDLLAANQHGQPSASCASISPLNCALDSEFGHSSQGESMGAIGPKATSG